MKFFRITFGITAAFALAAGNAQAVQYTDTDLLGDVLSSSNQSVSGVFNIATADGDGMDQVGYDHTSEFITNAFAMFTIVDWDGASEEVRIDLGGDSFASSSGAHSTGFTVLGGVVSGTALVDLDADGIVGYTVNWVAGDSFIASGATLMAFTNPNTANTPVPDGGLTIALLGMGLVGLRWMTRK